MLEVIVFPVIAGVFVLTVCYLDSRKEVCQLMRSRDQWKKNFNESVQNFRDLERSMSRMDSDTLKKYEELSKEFHALKEEYDRLLEEKNDYEEVVNSIRKIAVHPESHSESI